MKDRSYGRPWTAVTVYFPMAPHTRSPLISPHGDLVTSVDADTAAQCGTDSLNCFSCEWFNSIQNKNSLVVVDESVCYVLPCDGKIITIRTGQTHNSNYRTRENTQSASNRRHLNFGSYRTSVTSDSVRDELIYRRCTIILRPTRPHHENGPVLQERYHTHAKYRREAIHSAVDFRTGIESSGGPYFLYRPTLGSYRNPAFDANLHHTRLRSRSRLKKVQIPTSPYSDFSHDSYFGPGSTMILETVLEVSNHPVVGSRSCSSSRFQFQFC
ncbi:hypothetical protein EVAR_90418_1 [Eumeta japonica]|uniref:Uncharacterized protein n=1 Tax=Eumeta variegata TaxID=151549 RepID=A0A4C1YBU0_EUMVA|nr:hypothetical protein EVAR_90418_1 [Eumeta japonica]